MNWFQRLMITMIFPCNKRIVQDRFRYLRYELELLKIDQQREKLTEKEEEVKQIWHEDYA